MQNEPTFRRRGEPYSIVMVARNTSEALLVAELLRGQGITVHLGWFDDWIDDEVPAPVVWLPTASLDRARTILQEAREVGGDLPDEIPGSPS